MLAAEDYVFLHRQYNTHHNENSSSANNSTVNSRIPLQATDRLNKPSSIKYGPAETHSDLPSPSQQTYKVGGNTDGVDNYQSSHDLHYSFGDLEISRHPLSLDSTLDNSFTDNPAGTDDKRHNGDNTVFNKPSTATQVKPNRKSSQESLARRTSNASFPVVSNGADGSLHREGKENLDPNNANGGARVGAVSKKFTLGKKSHSVPFATNMPPFATKFGNLQHSPPPFSMFQGSYHSSLVQPVLSRQSSAPAVVVNHSSMDVDVMESDMLAKLQESPDTITQLTWKCDQLTAELEKSCQIIASLQTRFASTDLELRSQVAAANRLRDSHVKLVDKERELVTLQGLLTRVAIENKNGAGIAGGELDDLLRQIVPETKSQSTTTDPVASESDGKTELAMEVEELRSRLHRATQEIDAERMRVNVRDREIEELRAELMSRTSFSAATGGGMIDSVVDMSRTRSSSISSVGEGGIVTSGLGGEGYVDVGRSNRPDYRGFNPERLHSAGSNHSFVRIESKESRSSNTAEYRRMFEKQSNADWSTLVDRILQNTDQQASIFLQQKLKGATSEQRDGIFVAVLGRALSLITNRFGNFLVQRCLEFGNPQQIRAVVGVMRGNVLALACDPFGCHVVQKALESVEEELKATLVTELFRKIPDTIVHKYACHVWQKVFEIRWNSPPAVMTYVNAALVGQWHQVALDETGSLVVQNIFENCSEQEKRPVVMEVLEHVVAIAKGQWGNWVIQHVLENGIPSDRAKVLQAVMDEAVQMSLDQFSSKVVEKALRIGGVEVMGKIIQKLSISQPSRPRIPLVDVASDQYGNYIVQYILNNSSDEQREVCARLIRRHMVSLRGSKYGQKVAFMVEKFAQDGAIPSEHDVHRQRRKSSVRY